MKGSAAIPKTWQTTSCVGRQTASVFPPGTHSQSRPLQHHAHPQVSKAQGGPHRNQLDLQLSLCCSTSQTLHHDLRYRTQRLHKGSWCLFVYELDRTMGIDTENTYPHNPVGIPRKQALWLLASQAHTSRGAADRWLPHTARPRHRL